MDGSNSWTVQSKEANAAAPANAPAIDARLPSVIMAIDVIDNAIPAPA
jgi:hypothetical protein